LGENNWMRAKIDAFLGWANHGWPTICLQSSAGLLVVFGIGCAVRMQWSDFLFGPVFGLVQHLIGEARLSVVGWTVVAVGILLALLTLPAQRRRAIRIRRDLKMLQRQDWRR
jgi:hypothetical protein